MRSIIAAFIFSNFLGSALAERRAETVSSNQNLRVGQVVNAHSLNVIDDCGSQVLIVNDPSSAGELQFGSSLSAAEINRRTFDFGKWPNRNWVSSTKILSEKLPEPNEEIIHFLSVVNGPTVSVAEPCRELKRYEAFVNKAQARAFYLFTAKLKFKSSVIKKRWLDSMEFKNTNLFTFWQWIQKIPEEIKIKLTLSQVGGDFSAMNKHFIDVLELVQGCEKGQWKSCHLLSKKIYLHSFGPHGLYAQLRAGVEDNQRATSAPTKYTFVFSEKWNDREGEGDGFIGARDYLGQIDLDLFRVRQAYRLGHLQYEVFEGLKDKLEDNRAQVRLQLTLCFENWANCHFSWNQFKTGLHQLPHFDSFTDTLLGMCRNRMWLSQEDQKFLDAVAEVLAESECVNLERQVRGGKHLDLSGKSLESIRLIRFFRGLKRLNVSRNFITDFNPLSYLSNLELITVKKMGGVKESELRQINPNLVFVIL